MVKYLKAGKLRVCRARRRAARALARMFQVFLLSGGGGMDDTVVHERVVSLEGDDGQVYGLVRVHAEPSPDIGTWEGWIEFVTELGQRVVTDRETTQPNRQAVVYWATGLEPVYLEGALQRAVRALVEEA
jgi:hypothetical protein